MEAAPLTLGTAGHIDHGKTTLIRELTGTNTNRLPEERARGISIALGYARLTLPSGRALSVIDVPGHERFVSTMVAGATGIDLYLMTIAADDGVMPQTREHAAVLTALGVKAGIVAITKADLADPGPASAQAAELLPGIEVVAVSSRTGAGLDSLRATLDLVARSLPGRAATPGAARLHIDRVFTIHGAGTVVTGTLWSGAVRPGEILELLPAGRRVRVRGVQVHDQARQGVTAGQRVAVNLSGVAVTDIARGDVLASTASGLSPTYLLDAALEFEAEPPEPGERVQIHHGTRHALARAVWLGGRFWQLRLAQPLLALAGDHLVVRRIAPPDTLGGGVVLDPDPRKHGPGREVTAGLERLARGEPAETAVPGPDGPRRPRGPVPAPAPPPLSPSALALELRLREAGLEPPGDSELDPTDLAALRLAGRAVRVSRTLHYHAEVLAGLRDRIVDLARGHGGAITLAQLRDELGTSRKFAQVLLEHLDSERMTIRRGDAHVLRAAQTAPATARSDGNPL